MKQNDNFISLIKKMMELPNSIHLFISPTKTYSEPFQSRIREAEKCLTEQDIERARHCLDFLRNTDIHHLIKHMYDNWTTLTEAEVFQMMDRVEPHMTLELSNDFYQLYKKTISGGKLAWTMRPMIWYLAYKGMVLQYNQELSLVRTHLNFLRDSLMMMYPEITTFSLMCLLFIASYSAEETYNKMKEIYECYQLTMWRMMPPILCNLGIYSYRNDFDNYYGDILGLYNLALQKTSSFLPELETWKQEHQLSQSEMVMPSMCTRKINLVAIHNTMIDYVYQQSYRLVYSMVGVIQEEAFKRYFGRYRDFIFVEYPKYLKPIQRFFFNGATKRFQTLIKSLLL